MNEINVETIDIAGANKKLRKETNEDMMLLLEGWKNKCNNLEKLNRQLREQIEELTPPKYLEVDEIDIEIYNKAKETIYRIEDKYGVLDEHEWIDNWEFEVREK